MTTTILVFLVTSSSASSGVGIDWMDGGAASSADGGVDDEADEIWSSVTSTGEAPVQPGRRAACRWEHAGWYEQAGMTRVNPDAPVDGLRVEPDGTRLWLYAKVCDGEVTAWQWFAEADPEQLAAAAEQEIRRLLPAPVGVFSPDVAGGAPATVRVPLWFAVPGQWEPVSAVAEVGATSLAVTAQPTALVFFPGDGRPAVSCTGPGPVWSAGSAEPEQPPACSYTYVDASTAAPGGASWPAVLSIRWQATWVASTGETGVLDATTTDTAVAVTVGEVQAVERSRQQAASGVGTGGEARW